MKVVVPGGRGQLGQLLARGLQGSGHDYVSLGRGAASDRQVRRRVVPGLLLAAGFRFEHPSWPAAAVDLVGTMRSRWSRGQGR